MLSLRSKLGPKAGLVYFSFLRHDAREISETQLLATVIMQLIQNPCAILPKIIKEYLTNYSSPSSTNLSEILKMLAKGFDNIFLVLDGLEQISRGSDIPVVKTCRGTANISFLLIVTKDCHGQGYGRDADAIIDDYGAIVHCAFFLGAMS